MTETTVTLPRPHAGQQRLDAALTGSRFGVVMCGRRFGKTKYGIYQACKAALNGERVGWFAPTYKYSLEAWREITHRLRPVASSVSEQEKRIELMTGGVVECWTMDTPDPARGREYHVVIIDEAGIVRDIEAIWQAALLPTLSRHAGRALFLGTPKGRTHGFSVMFAKGESGEERWASVRAPTQDNPFIPREEIDVARQELPPGVFAQEYEGIPADDGANPFGLDAIQKCIQPLSQERPAVWGWDFARAQDWTVGIALDAYNTVCRVERWQTIPWGEQLRKVADITGKVPGAGDATAMGGDMVFETLGTLQCPLSPFVFSSRSKQQLMERLAGAIQTQSIHFPAGVIVSELETFSYEYTAYGVRYEAPDGLHDDAVMALGLAQYAYDRIAPRVPAQPIDLQSQHRDTTRWEDLVGVRVGYDDQATEFNQLGRGW